MQKTLFTIFCLVVLWTVANADTKVKIRQTSAGQTYENTTYIKGKRQRSETNGGQMITITQCDLRRNLTLMPTTKTYMVQPYDNASSTSTGAATSSSRPPLQQGPKKGGIITSTITTRDTGERKQMFGYTARHIITTMVMQSSPDACSPTNNKMEIDGWYIDAAVALDCDMGNVYRPYHGRVSSGCQDRYETKQIGAAKKGFAVWEKMTMFGPNGAESFSTLNEVIDFSQATLDASLFEPPADYRQVSDFASMYGAPSGMPSAAPSTAS